MQTDPLKVTFDMGAPTLAPATTHDVVVRAGKVFEVGDYPDRRFSLSEEEADAAIAAFTPVAGNLEHRPTVLSGKVGTLTRLWREGKNVLGEIAVPSWLDPLLSDDERKVSAEWDRVTKQLRGWCWTVAPRVSDAVLMSAYAEFAGRRHSATDQTDMQSLHDIAVRQGAECAAETATYTEDNPTPNPQPKEKDMSFKDKVAAWFAADMPADYEADSGDEATTSTTTTTTPQPPPAPTPPAPIPPTTTTSTSTTSNPQVEALFSQVAELKREKHERAAAVFAADRIREARMYPYEVAAFSAAYLQAVQDDEAAPTLVTFTAEGATEPTRASRSDLLCAFFTNRPQSGLMAEAVRANIEGGQAAVLFAKETTTAYGGGSLSEEEKNRLLALSSMGRAELDDRRKNGNN